MLLGAASGADARGVQARALSGQCAHLGITPKDILSDSTFPVKLTPYGDVCFVAHKIPDPIPADIAGGFDPKITPYIALSLYRNGHDIYDFTWPNIPNDLWNTAVDRIVSVAFRKLKGEDFLDVIVIGHSWSARGDDLYHPLIFLGSRTGFQLDKNLSEKMFFTRAQSATMPELLRKINRAATLAATPGPVQSLAGRYSSHFLNGLVDGTTYWSDDVVEIVPVSDDAAYVRVSLQFYNGHSCGIWGVAEAQGNRLVYHDPTQPIIKGERACVLSVSRQGANLLIDDDGDTCKGYCGMRGSLMNDTLPFKSRRPITYMARLKASSEYNDAIKNWHDVQAGIPIKPLFAAPVHASSNPPPEVKSPSGRQQPVLSVTTLGGKPFSLAAERGKWVLVNYWATWCGPCTASMPALSQFVATHRDVAAIGLTYGESSRQSVVDYANGHTYQYPLAWLDSSHAQQPFGAMSAIPMTYLIAPDGTWVKSWMGQFDASQLAQVMKDAGYDSKE